MAFPWPQAYLLVSWYVMILLKPFLPWVATCHTKGQGASLRDAGRWACTGEAKISFQAQVPGLSDNQIQYDSISLIDIDRLWQIMTDSYFNRLQVGFDDLDSSGLGVKWCKTGKSNSSLVVGSAPCKKMHRAGFALADPPGLCAGICSALDAHRSFIVRAASAIGTQTLTNTAWTTPFRVWLFASLCWPINGCSMQGVWPLRDMETLMLCVGTRWNQVGTINCCQKNCPGPICTLGSPWS